jgi:hypothetical protein
MSWGGVKDHPIPYVNGLARKETAAVAPMAMRVLYSTPEFGVGIDCAEGQYDNLIVRNDFLIPRLNARIDDDGSMQNHERFPALQKQRFIVRKFVGPAILLQRQSSMQWQFGFDLNLAHCDTRTRKAYGALVFL